MIKIKHIDRQSILNLRECLKLWDLELNIVYDELSDLYDVEIGDAVPIFIKYWSGVNDNAVYLHVGSKILAIEGVVEIC